MSWWIYLSSHLSTMKATCTTVGHSSLQEPMYTAENELPSVHEPLSFVKNGAPNVYR